MRKPAIIGNAQGFWGDSPDAPFRLAAQAPDLDYLTLDYLAEVSLSIMAIQKEKDPNLGYARDFVSVLSSLSLLWQEGRHFKVVSNAGGLNPFACARACQQVLNEAKLSHLKIAVVTGDDVRDLLDVEPSNSLYHNLDDERPLSTILPSLVTANAYLGAKEVALALDQGADIVITGRVADPSLVVACGVHHFSWNWEQYHELAGATIAGHLIECGTQVTGGIYTHWLELDDHANLGFPIVELSEDGSCVVTKVAGTGGAVTAAIVKEQLLYEVGDPGNYLSPDVTLSLIDVSIEELGPNRVEVKGALGRPPSPHYKVSATYRDGYRAEGMLTVIGHQAVAKARRCGDVVIERLRKLRMAPERYVVECLGAGDAIPGLYSQEEQEKLLEVVLRVAVADKRLEVVEAFAKEMAPLVTGGAPGVTGYTSGRPKPRPVFGFWPCLVRREKLDPKVEVLAPCLK